MQRMFFFCEFTLSDGWATATPMSQQDGSDAIAFSPAGREALLTFTTFRPSDTSINAESWVEMVGKVNRMKNRHVDEFHAGKFKGYYMWFDAESVHIRAWALRCGEFPLDICYRCPVDHAGCDNEIVDRMVASIQHRQRQAV